MLQKLAIGALFLQDQREELEFLEKEDIPMRAGPVVKTVLSFDVDVFLQRRGLHDLLLARFPCSLGSCAGAAVQSEHLSVRPRHSAQSRGQRGVPVLRLCCGRFSAESKAERMRPPEPVAGAGALEAPGSPRLRLRGLGYLRLFSSLLFSSLPFSSLHKEV